MLSAGNRAVEDWQVLVFDVRRTFEGHAPADHVGGFIDLGLREAESVAQDREGEVVELLVGQPERVLQNSSPST